MNIHEQKALEQIHYAYEWVVGSYQDDVKEGIVDEMPSKETLLFDIYEQVMHWTHTELGLYSEPVHQIRFSGRSFIISNIEALLKIK